MREKDRQGSPSITGVDLRESWRVLVERRAVVLAGVVLIGAAALVHSLLSTPIYRAATTVQIERRGPEVLTFQDVAQADPSGFFYDFYETQYRIIQSRGVLKLAVERLDLTHRPSVLERTGSPLGRLLRWGRSLLAPPPSEEVASAAPEKDPSARFVGFLAGGLSVEPIRQSRLVEIDFVDRDPELARDAANAIADAFVQFNLSNRTSTTELATEFLAREVLRLQAEIADLEKQLQEHGAHRAILSLSDSVVELGERTLGDLHRHLADARRRAATAAARAEALESTEPESLPEVRDSVLINNLKQEYAALERRHGQMADRFKPGWPELAELTLELERADERLRLEVSRIAEQTLQTARAERRQALTEVENLERQIELEEDKVAELQRAALEFGGLKAEIANRRQLLNDLLARKNQTQSSEALLDTQSSNIRIVDRAVTPARPIAPRTWRNVNLGLVVGLLLGIGAAFLLDHLDNTIKDESDVQRIAPALPVLAQVPVFEPLRPVNGGRDGGATPAGVEPSLPDLGSHAAPRSAFAEAFKNLRTSILLVSADQPPRHILVTASDPESGKSTTSQNLALVLGQIGRRVLLIDADLRRPRLHRTFGQPNAVGLSSYLSGNAGPGELIRPSEFPNVSLITSGPVPPNPSELLGSPRLTALLAEIEGGGVFDHVVVDCPPLIQVADGLILSARMDAIILVVRCGVTTRESLALGLKRLSQGRSAATGVVLNGVPARGGYYSSYYEREAAPGSTGKRAAGSSGHGKRRRA